MAKARVKKAAKKAAKKAEPTGRVIDLDDHDDLSGLFEGLESGEKVRVTASRSRTLKAEGASRRVVRTFGVASLQRLLERNNIAPIDRTGVNGEERVSVEGTFLG